MTMTNQTAPFLIIGGTGKTGRRVAERLQARGLPVRIGSRAAALPFDWQDEKTWLPAVQGMRAAYITYYPDISLPGAAERVEAFVKLAMDNGLSRLVLLSGRGEPEAQRAEEVLTRSCADWTIVRASWFMQNFSESFFLDGVLAGEVAFPADGITEPFVDVEDIADVMVKALIEDGHGGRLYEVTGPRLLTFGEAVSEIGRAAGRDIRYVPVTTEAFLATLRENAVPNEYIGLLEFLTREVLDGRNESLADGVEEALGRPPRDFARYARETASTGIWGE